MASPKDRNNDEIKKASDALEAYKKNRRKPPKESALTKHQKTLDTVIELLGDTNLMSEAVRAVSSREGDDFTPALTTLSNSDGLEDYPKLKIFLSQIATIPGLVKAIQESNKKEDLEKLIQSTEELSDSAKKAVDESKKNIPLAKNLKAVFDELGNVLKCAAAVAAAGRSLHKARDRLDFHFWLEQELIKRSILLDEISKLNDIDPNSSLNSTPGIWHWEEIEFNIWSAQPLADMTKEERDKLSPKEYHEALIEIFSKFAAEPGKLKPADERFISENSYITHKNFIHIMVNLERRHLEQMVQRSEDNLRNRLLAHYDDKKEFSNELDVTRNLLTTYVEPGKPADENFLNIVQVIAPKVAENANETVAMNQVNTADINNGNAKKSNAEIQEQLAAKVDEKKKDVTAKSLLFVAACLTLATAVTACIPGVNMFVAPVCGVLAAAFTIAAIVVKPNVIKQSAKDIGNSAAKIKKQYTQWKKQNEKKQEMKEKATPHAEHETPKKEGFLSSMLAKLNITKPRSTAADTLAVELVDILKPSRREDQIPKADKRSTSEPIKTPTPEPSIVTTSKPITSTNPEGKSSLEDFRERLHVDCVILKEELAEVHKLKKRASSSTSSIGMFFNKVNIEEQLHRLTFIDETIYAIKEPTEELFKILHTTAQEILHHFDGYEEDKSLNAKTKSLISDIVMTAKEIDHDLDLIHETRMVMS